MTKLGVLAAFFVLALAVASPAYAVISPSPLDCNIQNGSCGALSGVGSLIFTQVGTNLQVDYQLAGEKIVGGAQFGLNFTGVSGNVSISGTGITGTLSIPIGSYDMGPCHPCFNFLVSSPGGIAENEPLGTHYTFTLSASTPLTLASVVAGGADNIDAGLHLSNLVPGNDSAGSVFAGETGRAVPEPTTLLLIGAGLVGVGVSTWRRRR